MNKNRNDNFFLEQLIFIDEIEYKSIRLNSYRISKLIHGKLKEFKEDETVYVIGNKYTFKDKTITPFRGYINLKTNNEYRLIDIPIEEFENASRMDISGFVLGYNNLSNQIGDNALMMNKKEVLLPKKVWFILNPLFKNLENQLFEDPLETNLVGIYKIKFNNRYNSDFIEITEVLDYFEVYRDSTGELNKVSKYIIYKDMYKQKHILELV